MVGADAISLMYYTALTLYLLGIVVPLFARRYHSSIATGLLLGFSASLILSVASMYSLLQGVPVHINGFGEVGVPQLLFVAITSLSAMASSIYGVKYMELYERLGGGWLYSILFNAFALSMTLIPLTRSLLWFLFLWEIMTITSYGLIAWEYDKGFVEKASRQYLFTMLLANSVPLITGVLILWYLTGTLDMYQLREHVLEDNIAWNTAVILLYIGFSAKAGLFPLHFWLPDAHPSAPSNVSSLLSGVMIKMGLYGLAYIVFSILNAPLWLLYLFLAQGILSAFWGSVKALSESNAKRLLAYSSISHIGYMSSALAAGLILYKMNLQLIGIMVYAAGLLYIFAHSLFKTLLFLVSGYYIYYAGTPDLDKVRGVALNDRVVSLTVLIGLLSISGLPPLLGYLAKISIFGTLFASNNPLFYAVSIILMILAPLTLLYSIKVAAPAFSISSSEKKNNANRSLAMTLGLVIPALLLLVFSFVNIYYVFVRLAYYSLMPSGGAIILFRVNLLVYSIPPMIYTVPLVIGIVLLAGFAASLTSIRGDEKISEPWTTGYKVSLERFRVRPKYMYNEITLRLQPLTGFLHEVYDCIVWRIPGKLASTGISSRIAGWFGGLNEWITGRARRLASLYSSLREFKLDEVLASSIIRLLGVSRSTIRMLVVTPAALLAIALLFLALLAVYLIVLLGGLP